MNRALRNSIGIALAALLLFAAPAAAARPLLSSHAVNVESAPGGVVEDPCGITVDGTHVYVSAYYAHAVEVFSASGSYQSRIAAGDAPEGPCQLVRTPGGALYANLWHEGVERLLPSRLGFDEAESTGVAVDPAGQVYVDDRTYVAVYEPDGTEIGRIGEGRLADAYGLAVHEGRLYVAEAATATVKVFSTGAEPTDPPLLSLAGAGTPEGGFVSLVDAALAIDPTNGHLLVLDDLQPGFEHPEAAVDEFDADGTFVGQVKGPPGAPIVDGGPSGLAVNAAGYLFVTGGNGELGNVFEFGPDLAGEAGPAAVLAPAPTTPSAVPMSDRGGASTGPQAEPATNRAASRPVGTATASSVIQRGGLRVSVDAGVAPRRLPREGAAPVRFKLAARIASADGSVPPQLRRISVEINRNGHLDPAGLPVCDLGAIQPATNAGALAACRRSLVGEGSFAAKVLITSQAPFPSRGKVLAFNGRWHGRPAILAHIYGTAPVPTSYTLPFVIGSIGRGTYGTRLSASLPDFTSKWGYVTAISLKLGRGFRSHGSAHSYLTAGCPAPPGFPGAVFPLSRVKLGFAGRGPISETLSEDCRARG